MLYTKRLKTEINSSPPMFSAKLLDKESHTLVSVPSPEFREEYLALEDKFLKRYVSENPWFNTTGGSYNLGISHYAINLNKLEACGTLIEGEKIPSRCYIFTPTGCFYSQAQYEVLFFVEGNEGVYLVFPGLNKGVPIKKGGIVMYPSTHLCSPVLKLSSSAKGWVQITHSPIYIRGTDVEREESIYGVKEGHSEQLV